MADPVRYGPLSFAPGEVLTALARAAGKNIVALLPDQCYAPLTEVCAGPLTEERARSAMTKTLITVEDDHWRVTKPACPALARGRAVSREGLRTLLDTLAKTGRISLDDVAAFAVAEMCPPEADGFACFHAYALDPDVTEADILPLLTGSFQLYRFYGSLTGAQRLLLRSGEPLSAMGLSESQMAIVADLFYNSFDRQIVVQNAMPPDFPGGEAPDIRLEPTLLMPAGIHTCSVVVSRRTEDMAFVVTPGQARGSFADAASMAYRNALSSLGNEPTAPERRFQPATRETWPFTFRLTPDVSLLGTLSNSSVEAATEPAKYEDLPQPFRDRADRLTARIVQQMKDQASGASPRPPPSTSRLAIAAGLQPCSGWRTSVGTRVTGFGPIASDHEGSPPPAFAVQGVPERQMATSR